MAKFRKPTDTIQAVHLTVPTVLKTPQGEITGEVGDWLVTDEHGGQYILKDKEFRETYEPADLDALDILRK